MSRIYNIPDAANGTIKVPQGVRNELWAEPLRQVTFLVRNGAVYLAPNPIAFVDAADLVVPLPNAPSDINPCFTSPMKDDPRNEHL